MVLSPALLLSFFSSDENIRDRVPGISILCLHITVFPDTIGGSSCQKEISSKINIVFKELIEEQPVLGLILLVATDRKSTTKGLGIKGGLLLHLESSTKGLASAMIKFGALVSMC